MSLVDVLERFDIQVNLSLSVDSSTASEKSLTQDLRDYIVTELLGIRCSRVFDLLRLIIEFESVVTYFFGHKQLINHFTKTY